MREYCDSNFYEGNDLIEWIPPSDGSHTSKYVCTFCKEEVYNSVNGIEDPNYNKPEYISHRNCILIGKTNNEIIGERLDEYFKLEKEYRKEMYLMLKDEFEG